MTELVCSSCGQSLPRASAFSKRALRTKDARCRWCTEQARPRADRAARPVPAPPPAAAPAKGPPPPPPAPAPAPAPRSLENAAARADEREALAAILQHRCRLVGDRRVEADLDLASCAGGGDDEALFGPGDAVTVAIDLPPDYPLDAEPTEWTIEYRTRERVPAAVKARLEAAVRTALRDGRADASAYAAIHAAEDAARDAAAECADACAAAEETVLAAADRVSLAAAWYAAGPAVLGRRLIYSHHIIAPSKRAGLRELSVALGVTALVKIGWPGVIVLEGDLPRVETFISVIQGWRWKRLAVRGEQEVEGGDIDGLRALPRIFLELTDMSVLASTLRAAGLEDLFRRLFK